jgi:hypothetical protein
MIIFMSEAGQTNNELLTEGLLCALSRAPAARKSSRGCEKEILERDRGKGRGKEEKGRKRRKEEGGHGGRGDRE